MTRGAPSPADVGLIDAEDQAILAGLGRRPNAVELRCFGVLWSEHCAYKHSRRALRRLPTTGPGVLQGPGENAGVVDLGDGWAAVWKMESHNHPSAVDPYNGAATGIGGIIRDVLSMGARPIALLDALRFGPQDNERARRLLDGVIAGIAGYGNSIGVPTVGGDLAVDDAYRGNPLVNVACLGVARADRIARGRAGPPGAILLYAGARTGRDGIGGAAFASEELGADAEREDRSAVQIGDPFAGKCLVEATLEALATDRVLGLQDIGAGGLACAAAEMAARAGRGVVLTLDQIPLREQDMVPHEVLLSESQERMLLSVDSADTEQIAEIFRRWGLQAAVVGEVTEDGRFRARARGITVVNVPVTLLTHAPAREVEPRESTPRRVPSRGGLAPAAPDSVGPRLDAGRALLGLLATPEVAGKASIYEQYDHMVGVRTIVRPGLDAAVLRLLESPPRGLALSVDGNGRWCAVDPYAGALATTLEAAANLACVGAEPIAVTDCLNFASPERPEIFWTFTRCVEGIGDTCRALGVPVVGGNVSFYNEGPAGPILPTPTVAMLGLIPDVRGLPTGASEGDVLVLLGDEQGALGGSLYQREAGGAPETPLFQPDVADAMRVIACAREAVRARLVSLAHDVSDGGLAVGITEVCLAAGAGVTAAISSNAPDPLDATLIERVLFGEGGTRFVCAVPPTLLLPLRAHADDHGVPLHVLGTLRGDRIQITIASARDAALERGMSPDHSAALDVPLARARTAWQSLSKVMA